MPFCIFFIVNSHLLCPSSMKRVVSILKMTRSDLAW